MGKKYNYFDDELEPPKKTQRQIREEQEQKEKSVAKTVQKGHESPKPKIKETLKNIQLPKLPKIAKVQKPKAAKNRSLGRKIFDVLKYILSMIGVNILLFVKSIGKAIKRSSETRASRTKGVITVIISLILVVTIVVSSILISAKKTADRHSQFQTEAYRVCNEYTKKYGNANYKYMNSQYGVKGFMLTGLCVVREMDFNDDGESELFLVYNSGDTYFSDVWAYNGKKFAKIYSQQIAASPNRNDDVWMSLYSKGTESFIASHNQKDLSSVTIFAIHSDEFRKKTNATYDEQSKQFKIKDKDVTDNFERVVFAPLREHTASMLTEAAIDAIDSFSTKGAAKKDTNTSFGVNINQAYYKIIDEYNKNYGVAKVEKKNNTYYIDGLAVVDLIDFDGDGMKELMLIYRRGVNKRSEDKNGNYISIVNYQYYCDIYSFNGSVAKRVYQNDNVSNVLNDDRTYYYLTKTDGNKVYYCQNSFSTSSYGRVINASSKMYKFDGDQFEQSFKSSYQTDYGYTEYYIDGERVYRSSFGEKGGYSVALFDGSEQYDSSIWNISYVQAPQSKEQYLNSQVTKTEEVIKTLDQNYNPETVQISK